MYLIHVLFTEGRISPLGLAPAENCRLAHRNFDTDGPLLANGQPFYPGLEVDAGFKQGANLWMKVVHIRCRTDIVEVYLLCEAPMSLDYISSVLKKYDYQVVSDAPGIKGMIAEFFPDA